MALSPFLSELDERARIRGSRDPLGVQPVWDAFGRGLIGNLSTVSSSVRDFKVLLLGYSFVGRIVRDQDPKASLGVFLRWEQLASYARHLKHDHRFRGTDRVGRIFSEGPRRLRIAADSRSQTLADQQRYGLWGLFSVPAQNSGLLEGSPRRLSEVAERFVQTQYFSALSRTRCAHPDRITGHLAEREWSVDHLGADAELLASLGQLLVAPLGSAERGFYREHLLYGGPKNDVRREQQLFADALSAHLGALGEDWTVSTIDALAQQCARKGPDGLSAAQRLREILASESLLAPAAHLFDFILARNGQTLQGVSGEVKRQWGPSLRTVRVSDIAELGFRLRRGSPSEAAANRWQSLATLLSQGAFEEACRSLLEQNREVMEVRGGGPWVTVESGRLKQVTADGDERELPKRKDLPELWRHAYFLTSLRDIARQLMPGSSR